MASATVRFDLGFIGGGTASGQATEEEWRRLEAAFDAREERVLSFDVEGARMFVRVSQIAWARVYTRDARVGFTH